MLGVGSVLDKLQYLNNSYYFFLLQITSLNQHILIGVTRIVYIYF